MKDKEILKKAIERAVEDGFKPGGLLGGVLEGKLGVGLDPNVYAHLVNDNQYFVHIFSHDFAEAFWKDEPSLETRHESVREYGYHRGFGRFVRREAWQFHLQQMVLEEEPLKYLERFLE